MNFQTGEPFAFVRNDAHAESLLMAGWAVVEYVPADQAERAVDTVSVIERWTCSRCGADQAGFTICQSCGTPREVATGESEVERLRAFAFGDAPDWEKANATLKHRVRELEAELATAQGAVARLRSRLAAREE